MFCFYHIQIPRLPGLAQHWLPRTASSGPSGGAQASLGARQYRLPAPSAVLSQPQAAPRCEPDSGPPAPRSALLLLSV